MSIRNLYNSAKDSVSNVTGKISDYFTGTERYENPNSNPIIIRDDAKPKTAKYNIPPVIPKQYYPDFIKQSELAGISPNEFGEIARREQGPETTFENAAMVGGADPTDKGLMQVNEIHNELIKEKFREELGREYDPNDPVDSMIAARMAIQEQQREMQQMMRNGTYQGNPEDRYNINMYNLGVRGFSEAEGGNPERIKRMDRYQGK